MTYRTYIIRTKHGDEWGFVADLAQASAPIYQVDEDGRVGQDGGAYAGGVADREASALRNPS